MGQVRQAQMGGPLPYGTACSSRFWVPGHSWTPRRLVSPETRGQDPRAGGSPSWSVCCTQDTPTLGGLMLPSPNTIVVSFSSLPTTIAVTCTGPSGSWHKLICFNRCLRRIICPLPCSGNSLLETMPLLKSKVTVGCPCPCWPEGQNYWEPGLVAHADDTTVF